MESDMNALTVAPCGLSPLNVVTMATGVATPAIDIAELLPQTGVRDSSTCVADRLSLTSWTDRCADITGPTRVHCQSGLRRDL